MTDSVTELAIIMYEEGGSSIPWEELSATAKSPLLSIARRVLQRSDEARRWELFTRFIDRYGFEKARQLADDAMAAYRAPEKTEVLA